MATTRSVRGSERSLEVGWNLGVGAVRAVRVALAIGVALVAFPLAGFAVALIELATLVWPFGEGDEGRREQCGRE